MFTYTFILYQPLNPLPHPHYLTHSLQVSDTRSRANLFAQKQSEPHMLELAELAWGAWLGYYNSQQVSLYYVDCFYYPCRILHSLYRI